MKPWHGNSGWWLINTIESLNGNVYTDLDNGHSCPSVWFSSSAFGGTNYSNTPIGGVGTADEPGLGGKNDNPDYFGLWANGKNFGICAWISKKPDFFQAVGDPLVTR